METQKTITNYWIYQLLGWLFLAMVFAAVVSVVYYQQMKNLPVGEQVLHKDPYAGWQTYKNQSLQIEFKYPIKYAVEVLNGQVSVYSSDKILVQGTDQIDFPISFSIRTVSGQHSSLEKLSDLPNKEVTVKQISGNEFTVVSSKAMAWVYSEDYIFAESDRAHVIRVNYGYLSAEESSRIRNQFLSSIRSLSAINSYSNCVAAGYPIMKSLPEKCQTDEGLIFVNYESCIQVIARARNPKAGEVREFPTPCDVPEGWVKLN